MTRHQLSLLAAVGAASPLQLAKLRLLLFFSANERKRHAEYLQVGVLLAAALGADDDLIAIQTKSRARFRRPKTPAIVLSILLGIILLEWGTYTLPRILEMATQIAHSCGLR